MPAGGWWQAGDCLPRYLMDLIAAEAKRLRPAETSPGAPGLWPPTTCLGEEGLGFDSLERLQLASALSEALHLHEGGIADHLLARPVFGEWRAVAAQSLEWFSTAITVRTSGSTGVPKSCPHQLADLEQEVTALATMLPAGITRIVAAVPCHHIYGFLFTILLPARLGVPVLDVRGHSPGALPALARPGDLIVGHPDFWAAAVRASPGRWPPGVTGVTSTAPCPAETADALAAVGLMKLVQIHGSSETAGVGWRDDPRAPYTLMPHWTRVSPTRLGRAAVVVKAPDRLRWLNPRQYHLAGRHDGAVQVGGVNVFPAQVSGLLREHPGVAAAAVRLMSPAEGVRLKAYIVLRDSTVDTRSVQRELTRLAANRLSSAEQPRAYTFGPVLPTDAIGKAADWPVTPPSPAPPAG